MCLVLTFQNWSFYLHVAVIVLLWFNSWCCVSGVAVVSCVLKRGYKGIFEIHGRLWLMSSDARVRWFWLAAVGWCKACLWLCPSIYKWLECGFWFIEQHQWLFKLSFWYNWCYCWWCLWLIQQNVQWLLSCCFQWCYQLLVYCSSLRVEFAGDICYCYCSVMVLLLSLCACCKHNIIDVFKRDCKGVFRIQRKLEWFMNDGSRLVWFLLAAVLVCKACWWQFFSSFKWSKSHFKETDSSHRCCYCCCWFCCYYGYRALKWLLLVCFLLLQLFCIGLLQEGSEPDVLKWRYESCHYCCFKYQLQMGVFCVLWQMGQLVVEDFWSVSAIKPIFL